MVGFEGRENVRSTLGFLESIRPLGATVRHQTHERKVSMDDDMACGWLDTAAFC